jgi:hypothetical protein
VIAGAFKLIATVDGAGEPRPAALYDLDADPEERTNLLADADVAGTLAAQVAVLLLVAHERLAQGPLHPDEGADAAGMDPALREWMQQLGYVR